MDTLKSTTKVAIEASIAEWQASAKRLEEKVRRLQLAMSAARKRGETKRELASAELINDLRVLQAVYSKKVVAAYELMVRLQSIADPELPELDAAQTVIVDRPEKLQ